MMEDVRRRVGGGRRQRGERAGEWGMGRGGLG